MRALGLFGFFRRDKTLFNSEDAKSFRTTYFIRGSLFTKGYRSHVQAMKELNRKEQQLL